MDELVARRLAERRRRRVRHAAAFTGSVFAGVLLAALLVVSWTEREHGARVVVLGSGDGVSTLITAGHQRILVLSGDDGEAFARAFGRSGFWRQRSLDLLVDATNGEDTADLQAEVDELSVKRHWRLTPAAASSEALARPASLDMRNGVTIALDVEAGPLDRGRDWAVTVRRGSALVLVVSGASRWSLQRIARTRPGVVIFASRPETEDVTVAPVWVLPMRRPLSEPLEPRPSRRLYQAFPGMSIEFRLHRTGVELPPGGVEADEPSRTSLATPSVARIAVRRFGRRVVYVGTVTARRAG